MEDSLEFSTPRGRNHSVSKDCKPEQSNSQLSGKDHDDDPPGKLRYQSKRDERSPDQHLVGDGVEDNSRVGNQVSLARERTIQTIGGNGGNEQGGRNQAPDTVVSAIEQDQPHEQRSEKNPDNRDDVGDIAVGDLRISRRDHSTAKATRGIVWFRAVAHGHSLPVMLHASSSESPSSSGYPSLIWSMGSADECTEWSTAAFGSGWSGLGNSTVI